MYDDKLILWNPGQLPPDWSLDRLLSKHPSQPSNPDIAKTLFLAGKIESWGRGIDLIRHACTAHGCPVPRFASDSTGFEVAFAFASVETPVETPIKTPIAILQQLESNPNMTLAEVAIKTGKSPRTVERASAKLVQEGKLRYVVPRKGGHWEVLK